MDDTERNLTILVREILSHRLGDEASARFADVIRMSLPGGVTADIKIELKAWGSDSEPRLRQHYADEVVRSQNFGDSNA